MYTAMGFRTDRFDKSEFKDFKTAEKLWKWCYEFLTPGNRCVVVHRTEKKFKWGMNRDRGRQVKKIGVYKDISQLPKW